MQPGLYVTFFDKDEPADQNLPPVGPLDAVVLRRGFIVTGERRAVPQPEAQDGPIDRWLEAELEMQRATGDEPGGPTRSEVRVAAREGVFMRFGVFGETREHDFVPELGPFAVVVVGPRAVLGDGVLLAMRPPSELAPWELTEGAGPDFAGVHKPDLAFRTPTTRYHEAIAPAPPTGAAPQSQDALAQVFIEGHGADTEGPLPAFLDRRQPELTDGDRELIERIDQDRADETLRAKIDVAKRKRLHGDGDAEDATTWAAGRRPQGWDTATPNEEFVAEAPPGFEFGPALWRLRFAVIGVLLLLVGTYGFAVVRGGGTLVPLTAQTQTVGIAQRFNSARWDYIVNGVQRVPTAGEARARFGYYIVRVGATAKGDAQQLSPGDFSLVDANGVEHGAEGISSGAFQGDANATSPYTWPREFPSGQSVTFNVIFDVDPSLPRGMLLKIGDVPNTRVKLD
jgi:hypothetical protein